MLAFRRGSLLVIAASFTFSLDGLAAPPLGAVTGVTGAGTDPGRSRIWAEIGFHDQDAVTAASLMAGFGWAVASETEIEFILPLAYADPAPPDAIGDAESDEGGQLALGNPFIGLHSFDERLRWTVGATLPIASDDPDDLLPLVAANAMHGTQDIWLWLPDTLGVVGRLRAEAGRTVMLAFDASAALLVPTADRDFRDEDIVLQPAAELALGLTPSAALGARFAMVWVPTSEADDKAQLSLAPFLRADVGDALLSLQLVMNLDEPSGFAFDDGGFWGLFANLATTF